MPSRGFTHEPPNGGSPEWFTPAWVFSALGCIFDLDPASPIAGPVPWIPAKKFYTEREDGLKQDWEGFVWLNPPYGRGIKAWTSKMANHENGLLFVYARTDTEWFHEDVIRAGAIYLLRNRVKFNTDFNGSTAGSPGCGSLLAAYGPVADRALKTFAGKIPGQLILPYTYDWEE